MIICKTPRELGIMREAGRIVALYIVVFYMVF
ncbi:hypothetical protein ACFVN6_20400, partial [Bacillus velezensis]